jgi:hypothetical protein
VKAAMTDDISWSARMSAKAKARQQAIDEATKQARLEVERPWREFVEARGGYNAHLYDQWFAHSHPAHGACVVDARTGALIGVPCIIVDENAPEPPPPEECRVCRDVELFLDTIKAGTVSEQVVKRGWVDGEFHGSAARRLTDLNRVPVAMMLDDYWPDNQEQP